MVDATDLARMKSHLALTSSADIDALVKPILEKQGITFFNFYKEFHDGSVIRLSNNGEWAEHYFQQQYIRQTTKKGYVNQAHRKPVNFHLWHANDWPDFYADAANNFNICHGISVVKVCEDGVESVGFATSMDNHGIINNFYLNNFEWLSNFCEFFKEQASPLINQFKRDKIILPESGQRPEDNKMLNISSFILTKRQISCSFLLLQGLTIKRIAAQLAISPRTVETHLNILKEKLNCTNKTELIVKLKDILFNSTNNY